MNRLIIAAAAIVVLAVGVHPKPAVAEMAPGEHRSGSLGFHTTAAPIGVRWWFGGQKVGLDAGLGFSSFPAGAPAPNDDEKLMNWSVDVGVPFVMHSWERFHLLFRPGLTYYSRERVLPTATFETDDETEFNVNVELEGEVYLVDNVSVSASHGVRFKSVSPVGGGDSVTSFGTFGNNFTEVGFHVYFLGGSQ